jgi:outer membrane murein-binding lipoprotein Lpp
MKKLSWVVLVSVALVAGCANRYKITLTNANVITTSNKPRLDKETKVYRFKDAKGQPGSVPAFRVQSIEAM